jgi:TPR repeat protein
MRNIAYNYRIGGCGLPQDNNKAIEWYTKAVNLGDKYAKTSLETLRRYISAGPSLPASPTDLTGSVWHETTGDFHYDYTFMGNGILWYKGDEDGRHTWTQNGNTVTLNRKDNYVTYKLQKVDPDTLEGTYSNVDGYTYKASFKRGSNRK